MRQRLTCEGSRSISTMAGGLPPPAEPPSIQASEHSLNSVLPPGYELASIKLAKEFFNERLPRRIYERTGVTSKYRLARIGELEDRHGQEAKLYSPWRNSVDDFAEFGVGVSLYFRQLLFFASVLVLCTIIYSVSIIYNRINLNPNDTWLLAKGSVYGAIREDLLISKSGVPDILVTIVMLLFAFVSKHIELKARKDIDQAQQTPQDYSIVIHNPAPNVTNCDVYKQVFQQFGRVVFVTITVDNGLLLKSLLRQRVIEHKLMALQSSDFYRTNGTGGSEPLDRPPTRSIIKALSKPRRIGGGIDNDKSIPLIDEDAELPKWKKHLQRFGLFETESYLLLELDKVKSLIAELCHDSKVYSPHTVYVTFDTEAAQRACLKNCYQHNLMVRNHEISFLKWCGEPAGSTVQINGHTIKAVEAPEPTSILWENLDQPNKIIVGWFLFSCLICGALMALTFFVVKHLTTTSHSITAAIFIAIVNNSLPLCMTYITWTLEVHRDMAHLQSSMMLKLVVVRCVNSAILLYLATTFEDRFSEETMQQVMYILLADALVSPLIRLVDFPGLFDRQFMARRQVTQMEMNVFYQGTLWHLAERYTDLLKTVFVGLFYSALVPAGIIVTAIAMITNYWTDKYLLFRIWRRPPAYDHTLATQTRKYVLFTLWVHIGITRVFYANWPYDDIANEAACGFFVCIDIASVWTSAQSTLVHGYGVFDTVVFFVVLCGFILYYTVWHVRSLFEMNADDARGAADSTPFSEVDGINCYCPVARSQDLVDPFVALDATQLPVQALDYLPLHTGGVYIVKDLSMGYGLRFPDIGKERRDQLFARLKYYPSTGENIIPQPEDYNFTYNCYEPVVDTVAISLGKAHYQSRVLTGTLYNIGSSGSQDISEKTKDTLPFGWEQRKTPDGKIYFANHSSRITQWKRPDSFSHMRVGEGRGHKNLVSKPNMHEALTDLPSGWEVRFTNEGRPYYVNHKARTTQWQHPRATMLEKSGKSIAFSGEFTASMFGGSQVIIEEDLPEGWQIRYTDFGRPYYANTIRKYTQWNRPT